VLQLLLLLKFHCFDLLVLSVDIKSNQIVYFEWQQDAELKHKLQQ